jgi:hypothetical protein
MDHGALAQNGLLCFKPFAVDAAACTKASDKLAETVKKHPSHLATFADLPMAEPRRCK